MILVDANSIGFAATATHDLRAGTVQTGGVFGFLNRLRNIRQTYGGKIYALWDARSWRYDDYPEYKANRKANPKLVEIKEKWKPQRKLVAKCLTHIGVTQIVADNMEADDLAARVVRAHPNQDMVLITGDGDWKQLISEHVMWCDPIRDRRVTPAGFKESTGFDTPFQFVQAKALAGDAGDNVPPVGGLGPKAAEFIFERFGSVQGMINEANTNRAAFDSLPKKYQDFVDSEEKIAAFNRNMRLVWLNHPNIPAAKNPRVIKGEYNQEQFDDLCGELAFHQILSDADAWIKPFLTVY